MTDQGGILTVEADQMMDQLCDALRAVESGRGVTISRGGRPLAEIRPVAPAAKLPFFPELAPAHIAEDAFAPTTDEEWPEECR